MSHVPDALPSQTLDVLGLHRQVIVKNLAPHLVQLDIFDNGETDPTINVRTIPGACFVSPPETAPEPTTQTFHGYHDGIIVKNFAGCVVTLELRDDGENVPVVEIQPIESPCILVALFAQLKPPPEAD